MPHTACPGRDLLVAFTEGALTEGDLALVESHLEEECPECERLLTQLEHRQHGAFSLLRRHPPASPAGAPSADQTTAPRSPGDDTAACLPPDRYEVLRELGHGGMGMVFLARQIKGVNRTVAVKVIRGGRYTTLEEKVRFRIEAESVARLQHPNIVQLYDVDEYQGTPFLLLEFIAGGTLADRLQGGPMPAPQAAALVEKLARAIHYAHGRGVLHRDLKPANVLLGDGDEPKVTDFGLAKRLDEDLGQTRTGAVMGTPSSMAPEQAMGLTREIGPPTDVYGLGIVLYECLTGGPAFHGASWDDVREKVKTEEPTPPSRRHRPVPRDLETICLKCLRKDASRRYPSAVELADDLGRFLRGEPITARPVGKLERAWRWCRRNRVVAGLAAAVALSLVVGAGASLYFAFKAGARAVEAEAQARRADEQTAEAEDNLYFAHMSLARAAWDDANIGQVLDLLARYRQPPAGGKDRRGWEWHCLARLCEGDLLTLPGHSGAVWSVAFSPDGRRLASASADGTVRVCDVTDGESYTLSGHTRGVVAVAFSHDGRRLASASHDLTVKVWDTDSRRELFALRGHTYGASGVAFSPDGKCLASSAVDGSVRIWDAAAGRPLRACKGHEGRTVGVSFSPDGRRLASTGRGGAVKLWEVATGREIHPLKGQGGATALSAAVFSPSGRQLALGRDDGTIQLWDPADGRPFATYSAHRAAVAGVAFSPDGRRLVSAGGDQTVRMWEADTGREVYVLRGHTGQVNAVAFSPDGRRLASASHDRTVRVWDAGGVQDPRTLTGHGGGVSQVAFSPDGRLASVGVDRTVRLWDPITGHELRTVTVHAFEAGYVAFSPDGRRLASGDSHGTIRVADASSGEQRHTFTRVHGIAGVTFSPDGRRLVAAGGDGLLRVWDLASESQLPSLRGHDGPVRGVAFDRRGDLLASCGEDRTVRLWDAAHGQEWCPPLRGHTAAVCGVAFSPDGSRLASASEDMTLRVWEVGTQREALQLKGHAAEVEAVAFSPEGRRLASASSDQTVRLWDASTGQELCALKGHTAGVSSVAFSPDGMRLASASHDRTVKVWDVTPLTTQLRLQREALGLVRFLFVRSEREETVLEQIRDDQTVSEPVRRQAPALVGGHEEHLRSQRAAELVTALYAQPLLQERILARIRSDAAITEPVRQRALALVGRSFENPLGLNEAAWKVVRRANATPQEYSVALSQAELACSMTTHANYLNTLGVAQYRAGQYQQAIETLTRSDRVNSAEPKGSIPADLAFLAMAHFRLGHAEQARAFLARLRESLKAAPSPGSDEDQAFLREAQALIERGK